MDVIVKHVGFTRFHMVIEATEMWISPHRMGMFVQQHGFHQDRS